MIIYLDAKKDLREAGLPDSPADVEKFEEKYIEAAAQYGAAHELDIFVETDPRAALSKDYDECLHTAIWQAIHNLI